MKFVYLVVLSLSIFVNVIRSDDLQVGSTVGSTLAYLENVKLTGIPFTTRTKNVFYSNERNQLIKAISAVDIGKTKGKATVTAGGVGFSFANIKLKSETGSSLNYQVQIFV